jgi:hypothetical protein
MKFFRTRSHLSVTDEHAVSDTELDHREIRSAGDRTIRRSEISVPLRCWRHRRCSAYHDQRGRRRGPASKTTDSRSPDCPIRCGIMEFGPLHSLWASNKQILEFFP